MRLHIDLNKEIDDLQVHLDAKNVEIDRLRASNAELVAELKSIGLHADANMEGAGEPEFSQFSWIAARAHIAVEKARTAVEKARKP